MRPVRHTDPQVNSGCDKDDPFRYGWRYCAPCAARWHHSDRPGPLTFEDLLYPEEDDFVVQEPVHTA